MATKSGKDVWVIPHGKQWVVKVEGEERALHVVDTQDEAIALARPLAQKNGGELVIQRPDGKIRDDRTEVKPEKSRPK